LSQRSTLRPLAEFPARERRGIRHVLVDIDDTLTTAGRLEAVAYNALERLAEAGLSVIPVTGRPAGWCDHFARMWPVAAVVGENGAFAFWHDGRSRTLRRIWWLGAEEREQSRARLRALGERILSAVPGAALAADQAYREADLAIDFCEDVPRLPRSEVDRIVALFTAAGARAKVSSIHVNGWFGSFDKLAMTRRLFAERFGLDLDLVRGQALFVGDSPNDAPMFGFFPHSVGVANVTDFLGRLEAEPTWLAENRGGRGFAELAAALLAARGAATEAAD